jgi:hypothetical protein
MSNLRGLPFITVLAVRRATVHRTAKPGHAPVPHGHGAKHGHSHTNPPQPHASKSIWHQPIKPTTPPLNDAVAFERQQKYLQWAWRTSYLMDAKSMEETAREGFDEIQRRLGRDIKPRKAMSNQSGEFLRMYLATRSTPRLWRKPESRSATRKSSPRSLN